MPGGSSSQQLDFADLANDQPLRTAPRSGRPCGQGRSGAHAARVTPLPSPRAARNIGGPALRWYRRAHRGRAGETSLPVCRSTPRRAADVVATCGVPQANASSTPMESPPRATAGHDLKRSEVPCSRRLEGEECESFVDIEAENACPLAVLMPERTVADYRDAGVRHASQRRGGPVASISTPHALLLAEHRHSARDRPAQASAMSLGRAPRPDRTGARRSEPREAGRARQHASQSHARRIAVPTRPRARSTLVANTRRSGSEVTDERAAVGRVDARNPGGPRRDPANPPAWPSGSG